MFYTIRQIKELVDQANYLSENGRNWSVALFNRSFILQVVATLAALAGVFGLPIPGGHEVWGEAIWAAIFAGSQVWALIERLRGKTQAVWNTKQAEDALTKALAEAGAPAQKQG